MKNSLYSACFCESGKKFKFCCRDVFRLSDEKLKAQTYTFFPITFCIEAEKSGLKTIIVGRSMPDNSTAFASYLIDLWCLGVKDALICPFGSEDEFRSHIEHISYFYDTARSIGYDDARSWVFGSIAYAQSLGFSPHEDWEISKCLIEPYSPFVDKFKNEFGKDGKPFYYAGPYDENCMEIAKKVKAAGGDYVIPL